MRDVTTMRIAIIQNQLEDADWARTILTNAGHRVWVFVSRADLTRALSRLTFDLLLIDSNAGDVPSLDLLASLRDDVRGSVATVFLSDRADPELIAAAFTAGACDFILKPLEDGIFLSRVLVQLRRTYPRHFADDGFSVGPFTVNRDTSELVYKDRVLELSPAEFKIAVCLLENIGRTLSRDYIHEAVNGREPQSSSRSLDAQISLIRIKLRLVPEKGFQLRAIYGHGYRLDHLEAADSTNDGRSRALDWSMISSVWSDRPPGS